MDAIITGDTLVRALGRAHMTQADLARQLHIHPGVVSRWTRGRAPLRGDQAEAVAAVLAERGVPLDLTPGFRVFLSTPMASWDGDGYQQARTVAEQVYAALERVAGPVYWPAGGINSRDEFEASDLATARNVATLRGCEAFVFLQTGHLGRPSSSHIELGMAIALRAPITVFAPDESDLPYMLHDFAAVAAQDGGRYRFCPAGDALRLLRIHGPELIGLTAAAVAA